MMKIINRYIVAAMLAVSMGMQAEEQSKSVLFVDANTDLWERDELRMYASAALIVVKNAPLAAKVIVCNPTKSVCCDAYKAIRGTLHDAKGKRIHGLHSYLDYFATRYNESRIMDMEAPLNEALAHIKPIYRNIPWFLMMQKMGNRVYVMSPNDRISHDKKMASYVRQLEEKGIQVPDFASTFIAPEFKECHESGAKSQECMEAMKVFAGNPENIVFAWATE